MNAKNKEILRLGREIIRARTEQARTNIPAVKIMKGAEIIALQIQQETVARQPERV